MRKSCTVLWVVLILLFCVSVAQAQPPRPYRIGGTLTVNGTQLTSETDTGYVIEVTRADNTSYTPAATDSDGLSPDSGFYIINIPIFDADDQPGGARPGDTAVIHVRRNGQELDITSPQDGLLSVGESGTNAQLNIEAQLPVQTNQPPSADAGSDRSLIAGETVTLDGTASTDPDNDPLSYQWTQISGPDVPLTNPSDAQASFTVPADIPDGTVLVFELAVQDGRGGEDRDTVSVTVNQPAQNQPPIANAGPDRTAREGSRVILDGTNSTDPDSGDSNGIVSYSWQQLDTGGISVSLTGASTSQAEFTAPDVGPDGEALEFELTVTDRDGQTATDRVIVNVTSVNQPPNASAGPNQTVTPGQPVTLDGTGSSDPDDGGTIVTYQWRQTAGTPVALSNANIPQPAFIAPATGSGGEALVFELTVTDSGGLQNTDSVTVNVAASQGNQPPSAEAGPNQTVNEGDFVTLNGLNSTDPENAIILYLWNQVAGIPVTLSNPKTAETSFSAPEVGTGGLTLVFELTVVDAGGLQDTDRVLIQVTQVRQPPVANAGADRTVAPGTVVELDGSASLDPDGQILTHAWTQLAGTPVTLSGATTPTPEFVAPVQPGTLRFELTVVDNDGLRDTDEVSVGVTVNGDAPPAAEAGADISLPEGTTGVLNAAGSRPAGGEITAYRWRQIAGPPVRISDPAAPQTVFFVPAVENDTTLTFELTVQDSTGLESSDTVNAFIIDSGEGDDEDDSPCFISTSGSSFLPDILRLQSLPFLFSQ